MPGEELGPGAIDKHVRPDGLAEGALGSLRLGASLAVYPNDACLQGEGSGLAAVMPAAG
jgi:hypothetical protein